jgi:thermitase
VGSIRPLPPDRHEEYTMTTSTLPRLLLPLTFALLTACTALPQAPAATAPIGQRPGTQLGPAAARYDMVASVPVQPGDTRAALEAATGGVVLNWASAAACGTATAGPCEVLVGLNGPGGLNSQAVVTQQVVSQTMAGLSARLGRPVTAEANRDVFSGGGVLTATMGGARAIWAGGSLQAWAEGARAIWAGGARAIWAGGQYSPLPQNTQAWTAIHLQEAQTLAPNLGAGVTVAVIDTGLDLSHPAFIGALSNPSTWHDFYANDAVPQDEGTLGVGGYGHGTNVAGIILQIAPQAKIMPLRVLGPDGSGDVATIAQAIAWAVSKGANIINLSLGSSSDSKAVQEAIKAATGKNVLVISSAGNDNRDKISFPASAATKIPGALSVGSVDAKDVKSKFSNYSSDLEIVAPGENVYAPAPENLMAAWSGTSQAAPIAAGALALALGQGVSVPVNTLPDQLAQTAINIYSIPQNKSYNDRLGEGRIEIMSFLSKVLR